MEALLLLFILIVVLISLLSGHSDNSRQVDPSPTMIIIDRRNSS